MILAAWLFGPLFNLARLVPTTTITPEGFCIYNLIWPNRFWFVFTSVIAAGLYFFFPLIFILTLYISIFLYFRKMASSGSLTEGNNKQAKVMDKAKDNVFKTLLFLSTCFFSAMFGIYPSFYCSVSVYLCLQLLLFITSQFLW